MFSAEISGMVAGEDDHGLRLADQRQRGADGAAGAVGLRLDDGLGSLGKPGGDVLARRDDRGDPVGAGLAGGEDRPGDHRPPADGVQHLGQSSSACGCLRRPP